MVARAFEGVGVSATEVEDAVAIVLFCRTVQLDGRMMWLHSGLRVLVLTEEVFLCANAFAQRPLSIPSTTRRKQEMGGNRDQDQHVSELKRMFQLSARDRIVT